MLTNSQSSTIAVVLGGHVNGFSIITELHEQGITNIALLATGKCLGFYSNKVIYKARVSRTPSGLSSALKELHNSYSQLILYPTDDLHLEELLAIYDEVEDFCFLPFNPSTLTQSSDKFCQYQACEQAGVPYPKTISFKQESDLKMVEQLMFPVLVKPSTRKDLTVNVFRALYIENQADLTKNLEMMLEKIEAGIEFIVSEYIPGDDTNIYAYTCFRSDQGHILNEWTGKKLTQFPNNYGVVSSASNEAPEVVLQHGRAVVEALDAYGIVEPEFKFDHRDGKYKLMETNLRSMMWNRAGTISGVKLHETQFNYAVGQAHIEYKQEKKKHIHLVLMMHEIPNLIARKGYWKHFKHNVWGGDKRVWAIYDPKDIKPFFFSLYLLGKRVVGACLRRLNLR